MMIKIDTDGKMRPIGFIAKMLCIVFTVQSISVSAQSIRYSNFYDSSNQGAEIFKEVVRLDNGSLLVIGGTANAAFYPYIKTINVVVNSEGGLESLIERQSATADVISIGVVKSPLTGAIYEAGTLCDYSIESTGDCDFYVAKLNSTGDTLFTSVIERSDTNEYLLDIVQTRPNKLLLIGWTYNDTVAASSAAQLLFITVDTLGNELNRVIWGGSNTDYIHSGLVINEEGEVLMTGGTKSFGGSDYDTWLVKTDSIGNVLWFQTYNHLSSSGGDAGTCVVPTIDGNFAILGGSANASTGTSDGYIMKVNPTGNVIWTKKHVPSNGSQSLWWGEALSDGSIVACGQTTDTEDGSQAGWLVKADANGDTLWTRTFNPSNLIDRLLNMLLMPNGDIVMVGSGRAPGQTIQDGWVLRVDSDGCLVEGCSVGVEDLEQEEGYFIAYPNPTTSTTTLTWQGQTHGNFQLSLYDVHGRLLLNETLPTAQGSKQLDMSTYAKGIYFGRLLFGDEMKAFKLVKE